MTAKQQERKTFDNVILGIYAKNVVIWVKGGKTMREAGMIRFVEMAIFSGVQQLFFIRKVTTRGGFNCQNTYDSFRRVAVYFCEPWAGGLTQGGNFQKILDNSFQVVAVGWVQPVICRIPFYE